MAAHRGRVGQKRTIEKQPPPKLVFGLHQVCSWCKGTGKRPKRKELCGACGGTGYYDPSKQPE